MQFQKETLTEQQKGCNIRRTLVLITRTGDKYMKNGEKKDTVGEGCRYAADKNHKRRATGGQQDY